MIKLTTMNQQVFFLNSTLIYRIEASPDTVITLVDGKTLMVRETPERVVELVLTFQQAVHSNPPRALISKANQGENESN
ncbi:flagellar FlbD family protein [Vagococcus sp. BWB3-3]|uniref:Flagellar FlbD family protein n=1 Tax=Vagococcus allomyrinae TaxID=2794353 RepID=A0A940PC34_9ENTE|nr:flagellar FlbD family protein [Vagococcus allomyrinae]MBP1042040.1 flagellar FlbD family protein [Vagococcus allomyrinae]